MHITLIGAGAWGTAMALAAARHPGGHAVTLHARDAAQAEADKRGLKVTIVVVDPAGILIALRRMDDASIAGPDIATGKAQTAARFGNPTALFEQRLQKEGQLRYLTFPVGVVASEGGVPIKRDGKTVGAVGVSGATSQEDGLIAAAGIAALEAALAPKK